MRINRKKLIIFLFTIALFLVAISYLLKGFSNLVLVPLKEDGARDLFLRWQEQQYVYKGLYPYFIRENSPLVDPEIGPIRSGGYLPWSFFTGFFLIPKLPWPLIRIYHAFLNLAALIAISILAYQTGAKYGKLPARLFLASVLAIGSNATTLNVGQYGLIINGFLCGMYWSLQAHKQIWAGLFLGLAMVKPNISGLYFFILVVQKKIRALIAFFLYMLVANLVIGWVLKTNPISLVMHIIEQSKYFASKGTSAIDFASGLGLEIHHTVILVAILASLIVTGIFYYFRNYSLLTFFAIACVLGRIYTYHLFYDNVMLVFLLIALLKLAYENPHKLNILMYLLVGISLWVPASIRNLKLPFLEPLQILIWVLGLVYLVASEKLQYSQSKKALNRATPKA